MTVLFQQFYLVSSTTTTPPGVFCVFELGDSIFDSDHAAFSERSALNFRHLMARSTKRGCCEFAVDCGVVGDRKFPLPCRNATMQQTCSVV